MYLRNAWLPAVAGLVLLVGCDSKPADTIPKTAPMAAKEAFELLPHLKYIAVRKDLKDIPVIAPDDMTGLYGNAWWFHNHAGQMDLTLTEQEIKDLGVEPVKDLGYLAPGVSMAGMQLAMDKLDAKQIQALPVEMSTVNLARVDKLPGENDKVNGKDFVTINGNQALLRATFNAGLYRLLKGVPAELWNSMELLKTTPNPKNSLETGLVLGLEGKPVIELTARQKADKTYAIIYVHYLVQPRVLAKAVAPK